MSSEIRAEELKMVKESKLIIPDKNKQKKTNIGSLQEFNRLLKKSWDRPEDFWADVASELFWYHPWEKTIEGELPNFKFFVGGISNPAYNMLDINLERGYGNKLALIWEGENYETKFYTYRMLYCEVNKFCNVLKSFGLKKGDRVAIYLPNFAETVIAILACYRMGVLFNTVFSGFSPNALKDRLINFEPQVFITADGGYRRGRLIPLKERADLILNDITGIKACIVVKRAGNDVDMKEGRDYWWDDLMKNVGSSYEPELIEANEPGLVFYTSGTAGKPKGVVHSGNAFVINNYVYAKYHLDLHPDDIFWCMADIGWLTMHIWGVAGALSNGVTTVFYEGSIDYPTHDRVYKIIEKYRISKWWSTPTATRLLMKFGEDIAKPYDLSSLDVIAFVGEPLNPEAWWWLYDKICNKNVYLNNTYGQTETAGCPLAGAAWLTPMKPGSCGINFLGAHMDIVDENGKSVPPMTVGNLIMRKPIPMLVRTLWKDHEGYLKIYFSQVQGAYFTYDVAIKDNDGHYWVLARTDDVINVAGHRLSTMEVESVAAEVDGVAEAAVVGTADVVKGSVPVIFVTIKEGYDEEKIKQQIINNIIEKISKIAVPANILNVPVMPKTPSGKIMRRLLREIIEKGNIESDITGLENPESIEIITKIVKSKD
ncbi:MAG: acetate--CoA ligase [Deferribacterota bacterium]|nr:acetate--CoA ligase [Deferribacterota bacterium]